MKEKERNGKSELSDFLRYAKGEMTDRERNAFERELQKDPFAEEAAEGLSQVSAEAFSEDIARLQKRLKSKIAGRQRFIYYRIAASVAVLMIISSVFFIVHKQGQRKEPGEVAGIQTQIEIEAASEISSREKDNIAAERETEKVVRDAILPERTEAERRRPSAIVPETRIAEKRAEPVAAPEINAYAGKEVNEAKAAPVTPAGSLRSREITVKGKVISAEDNMPIAGVSVIVKGTDRGTLTDTGGNFRITLTETSGKTLIAGYIGMKSKEFQAKENMDLQVNMEPDEAALAEVVVVGYGTAKPAKAADDEDYQADETGYSPPVPAEGKDKFNDYIKNNIRTPLTLEKGDKAVVVLNFIVKNTGETDSIRIVRSPGTEFSDEAKRLILEGPEWIPAVSGGKRIDVEVRVRIVFK